MNVCRNFHGYSSNNCWDISQNIEPTNRLPLPSESCGNNKFGDRIADKKGQVLFCLQYAQFKWPHLLWAPRSQCTQAAWVRGLNIHWIPVLTAALVLTYCIHLWQAHCAIVYMCDTKDCVCVCVCDFDPCLYLSDLEMHLLLNSVLFNKKAVMPRVLIRRKCVGGGFVGEVCGEVLIIISHIPNWKCFYSK